MDLEVIKSYLVSLGFTVDQPELNKFNSVLRDVAVSVERFTVGTPLGIVGLFAKAGAAIAATLTTIAAGTVGLMDHVANADLDFKLFARRMFMTENAAKSLKIATDALGYSLEDIVWGPKELRDRFGVLISDQQRMQTGLGPDYEKQLKTIRDIRFEFTRLEVEGKYFAMYLVKSLGALLGGDESTLLRKFREFNDWFQKNMPRISQELATRLVPILRDVFRILKDFYDIGSRIPFRKIADDTVYLTDKLKELVDFVTSSPILQKMMFGAVSSAAIGSVVPGVGTTVGGVAGAAVGGIEAILGGMFRKKQDAQQLITNLAKKMGLDPAIALAIADKETGINPNALRGKAGEVGMFQLMPDTAKMLGVNPFDVSQNAQGGIEYLLELYAKFHDWRKAITAYNGRGPAARAYADDVINNRIPKYHPQQNYGGSGTTIGRIDIHISQPNANAEQIQAAVTKGVSNAAKEQHSRVLTQLSGTYA